MMALFYMAVPYVVMGAVVLAIESLVQRGWFKRKDENDGE